MNDDPIDFKSALVEAIDVGWRTSDHPDPEDLARLRRGELAEEHAEPLRAHLLGCRECMARWRSPEAFAAEAAGEFERAAFWRSLEPRLARVRGVAGAEGARPPAAPASGPATWLQRFSPWLAAACLVAAVGLSVWVQTQQRELARPRANAPIYDLDAAFAPRGGGGTEPLEVPAGVGFTLIVTPDTVPEEAAAELGVVDSAGREVHTVRGLVPHPADGTFSLWLPAGALAAGDYRLELRRVADGERTLLETYVLRVVQRP